MLCGAVARPPGGQGRIVGCADQRPGRQKGWRQAGPIRARDGESECIQGMSRGSEDMVNPACRVTRRVRLAAGIAPHRQRRAQGRRGQGTTSHSRRRRRRSGERCVAGDLSSGPSSASRPKNRGASSTSKDSRPLKGGGPGLARAGTRRLAVSKGSAMTCAWESTRHTVAANQAARTGAGWSQPAPR